MWLLAVGVPIVQLWRFKTQPGAEADAPPRWPVASCIERDPALATVLLFAHPLCPCTAASLGELRRLVDSVDGVLVHVLFKVPADADDSWRNGGNWVSAQSIHGVRTHEDLDGVEATRFAALTSGHVVAYSSDGTLVFQGGLTTARGHAGPSPCSTRLIESLKTPGVAVTPMPVFGCPLRDPK